MARVPLASRLRRRAHRELAAAQDIVVADLYANFPRAILRGGTAIWRCYGGNRFSEDVDAYLPTPSEEALDRFAAGLEKKGLTREKLKRTENAILGKFSSSGFPVRMETVSKSVKDHFVKPFEMADGTFITVNVLSPEGILLEKVAAYRERTKVRDLYDIFFLINLVQRKAEVVSGLRSLLESFRAPDDSRLLRTLMITGSVPSVAAMVEEIQRWAG